MFLGALSFPPGPKVWMLMCQSDWVVNPEVDGWKRHRQQFLLKSIRPLTVKQELGIAAVLKKVAIGKGLGLSRQRVKKRQFCVSGDHQEYP